MQRVSVESKMEKAIVIFKYVLPKKPGKNMKLMSVFRKPNG